MVKMSSITAENYHLKWDSHLSYLNLSVSTLFKNEKYADVMLLSSNPEGGAGIPAHRIILSSCSHVSTRTEFTATADKVATVHKGMKPGVEEFVIFGNFFGNGTHQPLLQSWRKLFKETWSANENTFLLLILGEFFASIFEGNPTTPNNLMYIVLPPELSRRSIQILVQYIYSGEATVSNDILNEVLRGGEILKIRGLCRSNSGNQNTATPNESKIVENGNSQKSIIRTDCEKRLELRGLGASATAIPKESPVIVKSPQVQQQSKSLIVPQLPTPNITVNKEFAIDPDESHKSPSTSFGNITTSHLSRITKKLHPVSKVLPKNILPIPDHLTCHDKDRLRRHSEDALLSSRSADSVRDEILNMCRRISPDQVAIDRIYQRRTSVPEATSHETQIDTFKKERNLFSPECPLDESLAESLDLMPIKEEPSEWSGDHDSESITSCKQTPLDVVKIEESFSDDEDQLDSTNIGNPVYSPLTCELCSETFTHPAEWVRHIESHMDIPTKYIPKKRKRIAGTSTERIASLKCDLCSTQFETPAEWVRHIQNTHTETELAISNNSEVPRTYRRFRKTSDHFVAKQLNNKSSNSMWSSMDRNISSKPKIKQNDDPFLCSTCDICEKKFSSYGNMIVHRRSHTADTIKKSSPDHNFSDI